MAWLTSTIIGPTGYTKKYKHVDRHKYLTTYAKMLGYITDDPPETDDELKSLTIAFVNSKGERVDPKTMEHTRPTRVIENHRRTAIQAGPLDLGEHTAQGPRTSTSLKYRGDQKLRSFKSF